MTPRKSAAARSAREPHLAHFVVLSLLLHALAIALFGAPSGGNPEGRAMWGALRVVLATPFQEPGPALRLDRGLGSALPGSALAPRPSVVPVAPSTLPPPSAVASPALAAPPVAPAAPPPVDLNVTRQINRPATPDAPKPAPPSESTAPAEVLSDPAPIPAPFVTPPLIERIRTPELKNELLPALQLPPREAEVVPPAPPVKSQAQPLVRPSPIEAPVLPAPVPAAPAPPEERPATPRAERSPADSPAIAAPLATPAPPVVQESVPTPPVEKAPVPTPAVPVPRVERVVPEKVESTPAPTERVPPREIPATPVPPPTIDRAPARPIESLPSEPPARREPRTSPFSAPAPDNDPFGPRRDSPFSSKDAKPTPGLDLDASRKRARELAREGTGQSAIFAIPVPAKPDYKSKEELALEKARKPDCRTAHKDLGLLAIVPLVANEFGEGNCRW